MAKTGRIKDPSDGVVIYPQTLIDCISDDTGTLLKNLILMKDNTTEFVPTADYHPATKGYVDSKVSTEVSAVNTSISSINTSISTLNTNVSTKQSKITASGLLKGNGSGTITAATAGTDYAPAGFGLGAAMATIPNGIDLLTTYYKTGFYSGTQLTNAPASSTGRWYYLMLSYSEKYRKILAFGLTNNYIYCNTCNNGTWVGWQLIYPAVYSS